MATFASGDLTAFVRPHRDLHTMKDFRCTRLRGDIGADMLRFAGASAVAELVLHHTEQESHPDLFSALEAGLDSLEGASGAYLPTACLAGLWHIVEALGFAPQLDPCVVCVRPLEDDAVGRFDLAAGGVRCPACGEGAAGPRVGPGARRQIAQLLEGCIEPPVTHPRRHLGLVSDFVAYHVASTPMKSLGFLGDFLPAEED
jgi:recombinational DNA repair protein (RecF pathway)